jgi:hypothetical protein
MKINARSLTMKDMRGVPIKAIPTWCTAHSVTLPTPKLPWINFSSRMSRVTYEPGTTLNYILHFIVSYCMKANKIKKNVKFYELRFISAR